MNAESGTSDTGVELRAVILFSHGSLLCGAGTSLDRHAAAMRQMPDFDLVGVGYMNYSTPSYEEAVAKITAAGATAITVVPFFLAPGYFATTSLPKMVAEVQSRFPGVTFTIAEPIGADDILAEAVRRSAYGARTRNRWRDGLVEAGRLCRLRADCPIYGKPICKASRVTAERVAPDYRHAMHTRQEFHERRPSLLVLAHGSPNSEANAPMLEVLERVRQTGDEFRNIRVGYLECNEPSIAKAIDLCAEAEPDLIVTVPYFLHMGTHVASDLPDALDEGQARYPHITFEMGEYLGNMPQVTDVLARRAISARTRLR